MKVYVSIISHLEGMVQDQETVRQFNLFMIQEVEARGFEVTTDPLEADVMLMLPTYEFDRFCMDEYEEFKNDLVILTDINQIEEYVKQEQMVS